MKKTLGALVCIVFVFSLILIPFANAESSAATSNPMRARDNYKSINH